MAKDDSTEPERGIDVAAPVVAEQIGSRAADDRQRFAVKRGQHARAAGHSIEQVAHGSLPYCLVEIFKTRPRTART